MSALEEDLEADEEDEEEEEEEEEENVSGCVLIVMYLVSSQGR